MIQLRSHHRDTESQGFFWIVILNMVILNIVILSAAKDLLFIGVVLEINF
jgi:hypothetical protein